MEMVQVVFDLVAHPEYIDPLRDELKRVRASDGKMWTKAGIAKLVKMDSFMKESQRFRPPGLGTIAVSVLYIITTSSNTQYNLLIFKTVTMTRKCRVDIKLSNGIILPKGTHIGVAAGANALDSQYFDKPDEFDGFRFEKLRGLPGNENKYQVGKSKKLHAFM